LLPETLGLRASARPRQFSVLPLFSRKAQLGYCLIQVKGGRAALNEALRDHLSTALEGARLAELEKS
jgi:hypothetical protein